MDKLSEFIESYPDEDKMELAEMSSSILTNYDTLETLLKATNSDQSAPDDTIRALDEAFDFTEVARAFSQYQMYKSLPELSPSMSSEPTPPKQEF